MKNEKTIVPRNNYVTLKAKQNNSTVIITTEEYEVVVSAGEDVKDLKAGDEVVVAGDARLYKLQGFDMALVNEEDILAVIRK